MQEVHKQLELMKALYPEKFPTEDRSFKNIHPGNRIFIGAGCGEPQYLVKAVINYVTHKPKAFFDTELLQVWTLGVAPYADAKFKETFRHTSFFIETTRARRSTKGWRTICLFSSPRCQACSRKS